MAICLTDLLYMLWILRFKTALEPDEIPVLQISWHLTFLRIKSFMSLLTALHKALHGLMSQQCSANWACNVTSLSGICTGLFKQYRGETAFKSLIFLTPLCLALKYFFKWPLVNIVFVLKYFGFVFSFPPSTYFTAYCCSFLLLWRTL